MNNFVCLNKNCTVKEKKNDTQWSGLHLQEEGRGKASPKTDLCLCNLEIPFLIQLLALIKTQSGLSALYQQGLHQIRYCLSSHNQHRSDRLCIVFSCSFETKAIPKVPSLDDLRILWTHKGYFISFHQIYINYFKLFICFDVLKKNPNRKQNQKKSTFLLHLPQQGLNQG